MLSLSGAARAARESGGAGGAEGGRSALPPRLFPRLFPRRVVVAAIAGWAPSRGVRPPGVLEQWYFPPHCPPCHADRVAAQAQRVRNYDAVGMHRTQVRSTNNANEISDGISSPSQLRVSSASRSGVRTAVPASGNREDPVGPALAEGGGGVSIGPTVRRRRLGSELRRLREAHSFKLEDAADRLGLAPSTLSRVETGKAPTRTAYLMTMFEMYGVEDPGQRQVLIEMAREGHRKGWWAVYDDVLPTGFDVYVGLEAEASALRVFEDQVVHGLLQTEGYARTVMTSV